MRFDDRVAVVTGSARGIGKEIVRKLLGAGAGVVVADLNEDDVQKTCHELAEEAGSGAGDRILGLSCNVADPEAVQAMFKAIKEKFGRLDILVNNAGITKDNHFIRMTLEQWKQVIDVNLTGTFLCCRHGMGLIRKSPHGRIINIASVSANGNPGQANYAASKAGVIGLTKTLATELARWGVTCNAVAPGFIDTDMSKAVPEDVKEQWITKIPSGRAGQPGEIADAVLFLASDAATYITGDTLKVDGGIRM